MANISNENGEVLVLSDQEGNVYAIPLEAIESYRVSDEQKAAISETLGDDVSGFGMFEQSMMEYRADAHMADMRHQAQQERMIRSTGEPGEVAQKGTAGKRIFTGVLTTLRSLTPRTTG